jgi:signal peptidase I
MIVLSEQTLRAIAFFVLKVLTIFGIFVGLFHFVIAIRICRSTDMYPNIRDGDFVLIQRTHDVTFDDVILYEHDGQEFFGRIVAVAGETVVINSENGLIVNDSIVDNTLPYPTRMADDEEKTVTVGDGEVFVLGDFRDGAYDSREFGCIRKQDAIGRQIYLMRWRGF